jgi:PKD repeat protein
VASHSYAAPGTYTVTLTTVDTLGNVSSAPHAVTVHGPPSASFSVAPPNPVAGRSVTFDGSGSSEQGGTIASYSWDFGDSTPAGSGPIASHAYAAPGTYTVKLTVTDGTGASASTSKQVTVDESPTASIKVKTAHPATGVGVKFDGSASSDPDGSIVSYSWNFGDGSSPATGASVSHKCSKKGTYTVTLTITDSAGISSSTTTSVSIAKAAKIKKVSVHKKNGSFFLWVKVSGPGKVKVGHKTVHLHNAGTAKFKLSPHGKSKLKVKITFTPIAGPVQHKNPKVKLH